MKVVVLHDLRMGSRHTHTQYLRSFSDFNPGFDVAFANVFGVLGKLLYNAELVVLVFDFLSLRNAPFWPHLVKRIAPVLMTAGRRVAIPQDDYTSCAVLDEFCCSFGVDAIYSGVTKDLEVLYPKSVARGIRFVPTLAGYAPAPDDTSFNSHGSPFEHRTIDLGQRVRRLPPQFGDAGSRKAVIAERLALELRAAGFSVDVSTEDVNVLVGDSWLKFLGSSRFTTGRKSGASLADPHSRNADRIRRYRHRHPTASMEQVSRSVRLRGVRYGDFTGVSPRIFESAALGTCQILEEDDYFPEFEPWVHYVPLRSDFSNLDEIMEVMRDRDRGEQIAKSCHERLIQSGDYSYEKFVQGLFSRELPESGELSNPTAVDVDRDLGAQADNTDRFRPLAQATLRRAIARGVRRRDLLSRSVGLLDYGVEVSANELDQYRKIYAEWCARWLDGDLMPESLIFGWTGIS